MASAPPLDSALVAWLRNPRQGVLSFSRYDLRQWQALMHAAREQGLLVLLHEALRDTDALVPEAIREMLAQAASAIVARNLVLAAQLRRLLQHAQARGIACVPLRGVAWSEQLYGNPVMRQTGDLDCLVRRDQLAQVRGVFRDCGYVEVEARAGFAERFEYTLSFVTSQPLPLVAEPHWTLAYPPFTDRLDMDGVWARCVEGTVAGVKTTLLAPADLLLHLCLHQLHHHPRAPLLWAYEIDRMIRAMPVEWPLLRSVVREAHLEPLVDHVLAQVQAVFDSPIPEELLREWAQARQGSRELAMRLLASPQRGRERLALLLSQRGLRMKLRYALGFLWPSPQFIRVQYGVSSPWQVARTYVWRLGDLGWAGVTGLLGAAVSGARVRGQAAWQKLTHPLIWPVDLGSPEGLLAQTAAKYNDPAEVARASSLVQEGLDDVERGLVNGPMAVRGRVLDVGCGAGREAIALARLGYQVTGIDIARNAIEAARRHARETALDIAFLAMAAHDVPTSLGPFDYILATNGFYSNIPSRALRISTLQTLARLLKPDGALFLGALLTPVYRPGHRAELVDGLRRLRRVLPGRIRTGEPGDRLEGVGRPDAVPVFVHVFTNPRHLEEEIRRAGFVCRRIHEATWELRLAKAQAACLLESPDGQ